jgi:enhancer of polycomb-like protein
MSSTRASIARHVRQRKLNTKQPLRIIKEDEIDELPEDEAQRNIPQFETGVEKAEEVVSSNPIALPCPRIQPLTSI